MSRALSLRFPTTEIASWAKRYSYRDGDAEALAVGERSRAVGFYTREDFLFLCKWKTRGRPQRHYELNSEEEIQRQTSIALASPDEKTRMTSLIGAEGGLRGVSWPTASVFLHLAHKEAYPIIDFRALWSLQCERSYYTFEFWWDYVQACRALAADSGLSARDVDRALWEYSRVNQPPKAKKPRVSQKG